MEIVGLVVLYFLGSFLVMGFLLVTSSSRRGDRLTRDWGAYAARRRYDFARGTTPERPFRITGSRDALDFQLEVDARDAVVTRLRPSVRLALLRFPMRMVGAGLRMVADDDRVSVEWVGGEVEVAELDAAHAILGELCREA